MPHKDLEPEALWGNDEMNVQLSIAISLKRIADALTESNDYGMTLLARSIRDALQAARL